MNMLQAKCVVTIYIQQKSFVIIREKGEFCQHMKIGIIGGGAIGLLMGSYFAKNHQVTIYVRRQEQHDQLAKRGITRDHVTINHIQVNMIDQLQQEDCYLICVKQPQLDTVIATLASSYKHIPLIFLQNGMNHIEAIQSLPNPLYVGVVEHGALRKSDHHIMHTGKGVIRIANYRGDHDEIIKIIEEMNQQAFPIEYAVDWYELLAKKLMINAVINPLTALFQVKNRAIVDNPHISSLAKRLCRETARVLGLDERMEWERVQQLAMKTGENTSSMLADLHQNRETELEAITGYLLKKSKGELPYTSFVYHGVKALEVIHGKN